MEIERKFLVKDISNIDLNKYKNKTIEQLYIYTDEYTAIRKRLIKENENKKYIYTVKVSKPGQYGIEEIEYEIPEEKYNSLESTTDTNLIIKQRYFIPLENNLKIELDVFKGIFEGIIFAEIEFPTEEMAKNYEFPNWFDKELTKKLSNSMMAKMPRKEIDEIIKNIK